ncbi:MAG: DUF11 domain-containing protein [Deltaproteobacteria bacterium]|nr:DUF11 domain-containing protein [Deltaproteobacteria bacterium]
MDRNQTAERVVHTRSRWALLALLALALVSAAPAARAGVPITLERSFAGQLDFTGTGNTLRTASDAVDPCAVTGTSAATLTIPVGATVNRAYLYWAGSGTTVDSNVSLNGNAVTADTTFTETFSGTYDYFAGVADVTGIVGGTGLYTFAGLTVYTGDPHCSSSAVLAGWSLIVIYASPAEPTRVINLYDGFQFYRGSSIALTATNFLTPTPMAGTGRHGHLTWEGDAGNSGTLGGVSENLLFAGNPLTDATNPVNNQFNSTVNTITPTATNVYGVDLDAYNITPFLTPGLSSVTTTYSSGQDLVLLSAEIFSVPNVPIADLAITKTHAGDFSIGSNEDFTITVTNNGPHAAAGPITVTDTLPVGLTYVSGTGTGWACGAVGQDVTCTNGGLASGASLPALTLTVAVAAAAAPSVNNTATVSAPDFDNQAANDSDTDSVTVIQPNLSTSTKTVLDLNGGDAGAGDTLRYTITLTESGGAAASGVSVTDDVPANVTGFSVVSIPAGATDASTGPPSGANSNGYLNVTGIAVPASGSVTVVFDVTVDPLATPGTLIQNQGDVINPGGPGASPNAPDVTVSPSQIAGSGTKQLYLYDATSAPAYQLSRVIPGAQARVDVLAGNAQSWTLSPPVVQNLQTDAQPIPVELWLERRGKGKGKKGTKNQRNVQVQLFNGAALIGTLAQNLNLPNAPAQYFFPIPNAVLRNTPIGSTLTLTITNLTGAGDVGVYPTNGANFSQVHLPANTIINVDSVDGYDAPYPGGAIPPSFGPGSTVYVRSSVSDPFGDFDITGAQVEILDPNGTSMTTVAMTQVTAAGTHPKVYEYAYPIPAGAGSGFWTARVTATEGTEAVPLTDLGVGTFVVVIPMPNIVVLKTVQTTPAGSFHIPGTDVIYTIRVTNMGPGAVDLDTVVITDNIPAELELRADDFDGATSGPIRFDDGAPSSGLTYTFVSLGDGGDDVGFQGLAPGYGYTPGTPYDGDVTSIQLNPKGTLPGNGGGDAYFEIRFRARVR